MLIILYSFEKPNTRKTQYPSMNTCHSIIVLRKLVLRHLSLPRPGFVRVRALNDELDKKTDLYTTSLWIAHPRYVQPTFMHRWGVKAWLIRLLGSGDVTTAEEKYRENGYDLWTIGPAAQEKRGRGYAGVV